MKKFLVIGNPIKHSFSPMLHNYWIKKNNINAIYEKKQTTDKELNEIINNVRIEKLCGMNVTIPFKKSIISHVDILSTEAENTQSVNTIYLNNGKVVGHNTDIAGFELSINKIKYNVSGKKILILGAGGVVSSIVYALYKMNASTIIVTNRTKQKAKDLKILFKNLIIADWGEVPDFDIIINATSVGLNLNDKLNLDFSKVGSNKLFYDIIYNPNMTNFLKTGNNLGNITENGKMMFIYQAHQAFTLWHKLMPEINDEVLKIVSND